MVRDNAKNQTQKIRGKQEADKSVANPNSDPGIGSASPELGYQSERVSRANGENPDGDGDSRKAVSGGILRQLELIRERQLKYVRAHKQRLLARLAEDEVEEQRIMEDIDQLKVEILELIEKEEQE